MHDKPHGPTTGDPTGTATDSALPDDHLDVQTSHLRPDGTVFPPVTPDPPQPPGYASPLDESPLGSSVLETP